jgi:hypothetical protein
MSNQTSRKLVNQFGLSRDIPSPIKREVRKRCGFGCVVCGSFTYQYHHYNPPFRTARFHNPEGIILLCSNCHARVTKGLLSNGTVAKAANNPKCLEQGFSHFPLDIGDHFPLIHLGTTTFIGNPTVIKAFGNRLLAIDEPEEIGGPFRISAEFYNRKGHETCRLVENEWQGFSSNWDITGVGEVITVLSASGDIALRLRTISSNNEFLIEKLNMFYRGFRIILNNKGLTTTYLPDGRMWFQLGGATFVGNEAAIVLE